MAQVIKLDGFSDKATTQAAYPPDDDLSFVHKVATWWKDAENASGWLAEEKSEHDFVLGHQWDDEDYRKVLESGRYPLVINKTLPTLMVVSGYERMNRLRVRYLPVEQSDSEKAEVWTEVSRIIQEQSDIDFNKS